MAGILKIRDPITKEFIDIPMIVGPKGDTGDIGNLTINGKSPDAAGAVTLNAEDVGALPKTGTAADASKLGGKPASDYVQQSETEKLLPTVTASDAGKFLRVDSTGAWVAEAVPNASGVSF